MNLQWKNQEVSVTSQLRVIAHADVFELLESIQFAYVAMLAADQIDTELIPIKASFAPAELRKSELEEALLDARSKQQKCALERDVLKNADPIDQIKYYDVLNKYAKLRETVDILARKFDGAKVESLDLESIITFGESRVSSLRNIQPPNREQFPEIIKWFNGG